MHKFIIYITIVFASLLSSIYAQDDLEYKTIMRDAVNRKDYNFALRVYTQAKENDYYDIESLQRIVCEIFYQQKEYDKCLTLCQKLNSEEENSTLTDFIYICVLSKKGAINDEKIASIAKSLGESVLDKNILLQLEKLEKKDIDNVAAAISRFIVKRDLTKTQELRPYKTILTILFFVNEHYTDAYSASIDYLTMDNPHVIYYILGILREKRQEYNSAIGFFTLAIKNGYNHYDAYLQRAICEGHEKDYIASNIDLDTCLMIDSNYYLFYLKGINYNYLDRFEDAMRCLDYSITLNDTFADSYNYRGIVCSNIKEYAFAINDFKRALYLDKHTPFAHNNLGIALEKTGKIEQAIEQYKLSTKYEPYLSDAWYNLGRIYTDRKNTKKALYYLRKANELDPDIPDTYYLMGLNYQFDKKKSQACVMYNEALQLGHTLAQNKIDNYCNKEEPPKEQKPHKANKNRRNISSEDEEELLEDAIETDEQTEEYIQQEE